MQIVIEIPIKLKIDCDFNPYNELREAVKNGTPLPKDHGRLVDADAFERRCMFDSDIEDMQDVIYALRDYKPIIEAAKGV